MDDEDLLDTVARLAADDPRVADLLFVLGAASAAPHDIALLLDLAEQSRRRRSVTVPHDCAPLRHLRGRRPQAGPAHA